MSFLNYSTGQTDNTLPGNYNASSDIATVRSSALAFPDEL
jgi:hypothetical protein